ncbi:hypothetical protein F5879DRAFT_1032176 [Lentinula edodes]|nr:hypothetical protein F5879DRAFT_1032176 [Lentinula edodes]
MGGQCSGSPAVDRDLEGRSNSDDFSMDISGFRFRPFTIIEITNPVNGEDGVIRYPDPPLAALAIHVDVDNIQPDLSEFVTQFVDGDRISVAGDERNSTVQPLVNDNSTAVTSGVTEGVEYVSFLACFLIYFEGLQSDENTQLNEKVNSGEHRMMDIPQSNQISVYPFQVSTSHASHNGIDSERSEVGRCQRRGKTDVGIGKVVGDEIGAVEDLGSLYLVNEVTATIIDIDEG